MLTDLLSLEKNFSKNTAVTFEDVNKKPVHIHYDEFLRSSTDLQQDLFRLVRPSSQNDQRISIGVSCKVTAQLPICVYSIIQSGYVLVPLSVKPFDRFISALERTGTRFVLLTQDDHHSLSSENNLNSTLLSATTKIHQLESLPMYRLLEVTEGTSPIRRYRDSIMYIIQSSGTTGDPKLIYVTAGSINSNILDLRYCLLVTINFALFLALFFIRFSEKE